MPNVRPGFSRSGPTPCWRLHEPGNPVVLPTVWDAWSARLAVDAGFAALTVGSHPLADSIGKADQEGMTFDDVLTRVKQITAAVDAPISVDIESGYGEIAEPADRGAVGRGRGRPEHRGHRAQRGWTAAVGQRTRRTRRCAARGGGRSGRARGRQRAGPTCSSARTAMSPIASSVRSRGSPRPPPRARMSLYPVGSS